MSLLRNYWDAANTPNTVPWSLVAAGHGLVDTPLRKHSRLAVGYGNGGADPLYPGFAEGKSRDIGFLKLFITASLATLHSVNQEVSPFALAERLDEGEGQSESSGEEKAILKVEAEEGELAKINAEKWGVKLITLLQVKDW